MMKLKMSRVVKLTPIIVVVLAAGLWYRGATDRTSKDIKITQLDESFTPLKDHFNAARNKLRFVVLLSPT